MLAWAVVFLLISLVAAVFGFGGTSDFSIGVARIVFYVAIVMFAIAATIALIQGRSAPPP